MPVYVDLECSRCGMVLIDQWSDKTDTRHRGHDASSACGGTLERKYTLTPAPAPGTHQSERCVVYVSEHEGGKIQYPANNSQPVPERLRARGYVRQEVHVHQMGAFEKKYGVKNERRHWDRNGNGV